MNYLVEQINGSLTQWDKTHNIKVYKNVNDGLTTVSFAYYPQFWLPANQRPAFEKAFYQMVKRLVFEINCVLLVELKLKVKISMLSKNLFFCFSVLGKKGSCRQIWL